MQHHQPHIAQQRCELVGAHPCQASVGFVEQQGALAMAVAAVTVEVQDIYRWPILDAVDQARTGGGTQLFNYGIARLDQRIPGLCAGLTLGSPNILGYLGLRGDSEDTQRATVINDNRRWKRLKI